MTSTAQPTTKRIIVTGGSGKVGNYVIEYLLQKGHEVLNLDIVPLSEPLSHQVHTLKVDLTNSGQVFSALTSQFKLSEPFPSPAKHVNAVIHLAGYARNLIVPDNETFHGNIMGTFNVIEAACKLGIRKIVLASSICAYGVTFADGDVDFAAFPVEEDTDANPMDVYGLSKLCCERTARTFARKFGIDIYTLRIGAVIAPDEYQEKFSAYVNAPGRWKVHGWSYTDARDLGKMCHLAVLRDGLGSQVFNATNDEITNNSESTIEFLKEQCPNVAMTREISGREAPISNKKIKELLGFQEDHTWQKYYRP